MLDRSSALRQKEGVQKEGTSSGIQGWAMPTRKVAPLRLLQRSACGRIVNMVTDSEIIEISTPPSRRRAWWRLRASVVVLLAVAALDGALRLAWLLPAVPVFISTGSGQWALTVLGFPAVLFPAVLIARHPNAWQTDRPLLTGTLLLAAGELGAAVAADGGWWALAQVRDSGLSAWQLVVATVVNLPALSGGVVSCCGLVALGLGLGQHAWLPQSACHACSAPSS